MAVTVTATSNYVEGADRVRRFQIVGDGSYPTGGYDILAALKTYNYGQQGNPVIMKRIISGRHRTQASAAVGTPIFEDVYTSGIISALPMKIGTPANAGVELTAGTTTANLNYELVFEGY